GRGGTFVCNDQKTNSGKSMGGDCVSVILDTSGKCETAYIYAKPPDETCQPNSYLTEVDKCQCNYGYKSHNNSCLTYEDYCKAVFGVHAFSYGNGTCDCYLGYALASSTCVAVLNAGGV